MKVNNHKCQESNGKASRKDLEQEKKKTSQQGGEGYS